MMATRKINQSNGVRYLKLVHQPGFIGADGFVADEHFVGDIIDFHTARDIAQNLKLAV